jgi:predicted RNA binding protein YcfA (HicA-like mRNA interferase family)
MKLPRDLRGDDLIAALCRRWSYRVVHKTGSHVILDTDNPSHQRISIPAHSPLRVGTLNAILRAVAEHKGVLREELLQSL